MLPEADEQGRKPTRNELRNYKSNFNYISKQFGGYRTGGLFLKVGRDGDGISNFSDIRFSLTVKVQSLKSRVAYRNSRAGPNKQSSTEVSTHRSGKKCAKRLLAWWTAWLVLFISATMIHGENLFPPTIESWGSS